MQIQLVLNVFSVGCAGFSVLTPYRVLFVGLTATSLGASHLRHRQVLRPFLLLMLLLCNVLNKIHACRSWQSVTVLAMALALSGMPEEISLYDENTLIAST